MKADVIANALNLRRTREGEYSGACPACGYKSGFSVKDRREGLPLIYCHAGGCSFIDLATALRRLGLWPEPREADAPPPPPNMRDAANRMWQRAIAAPDTLAELYLRWRGYLGPVPYTLRFAYGRHPETGDRVVWPMMVALMLDGERQFAAIHRTFLEPEGEGKADLHKPKMTLGPTQGAVIPPAEPGPVLVVSEGIENGLSLGQMLGFPAWAAGSAGNLIHMPLPAIVERVVIAADRDPNGLGERKAAEAAQLWVRQGRQVQILPPPSGFKDWNDFLRGRRIDE